MDFAIDANRIKNFIATSPTIKDRYNSSQQYKLSSPHGGDFLGNSNFLKPFAEKSGSEDKL